MFPHDNSFSHINTLDRRQLKVLLTIDEHGSKIARNSAFDCRLLPVGRQMAIKNSVSHDFLSTFVDIVNVLYCLLSGVMMFAQNYK